MGTLAMMRFNAWRWLSLLTVAACPQSALSQEIDLRSTVGIVFEQKLEEMRNFGPCQLCGCTADLEGITGRKLPNGAVSFSGRMSASANGISVSINVVGKYDPSCVIQLLEGTRYSKHVSGGITCGNLLNGLITEKLNETFVAGKTHGVNPDDCGTINADLQGK